MNKYILGLLTATAGMLTSIAAATGAAASTNQAKAAAAAVRTTGNAGYLSLAIWAAVILAVFGFLWAKGYLVKIRNYIAETQEELKKCSWPSRDELKGSTVVVMVTIALLGVFTVGVDWILSNLIRLIT